MDASWDISGMEKVGKVRRTESFASEGNFFAVDFVHNIVDIFQVEGVGDDLIACHNVLFSTYQRRSDRKAQNGGANPTLYIIIVARMGPSRYQFERQDDFM